MSARLPTIGVTMGDPAGIGSEVIVKAYPTLVETAAVVVIGDASVLADAADLAEEYGANVRTTTIVEWGPNRPADAILTYIDDNDVDHVIMGSHGRSGVSRLLLGSVAETVARRSPAPVTVVR